jgi:hypothetical protein
MVVWTAEDPAPRYWTATGTDNPVILLAWSYKSWMKKIVLAYARPR